jgi:hypothetical protein
MARPPKPTIGEYVIDYFDRFIGYGRARYQRLRGSGGSTPDDGHDALLERITTLENEVTRLQAALADRDPDSGSVAGPIFVGGTGRSGTWTLGRLIGQHPDIATVRNELRFHVDGRGFRDVLKGSESVSEFAARITKSHYFFAGPNGGPRGLILIATQDDLQDARRHAELTGEHEGPAPALRAFTHRLVDPFALGRGARTWVETTPRNAVAVDSLHTVFPTCRVIHTVRDGRDVAASVVTMPWGPDTLEEGLSWWATRLRAAERGSRAADPKRLLVIRLEELIHLDRDRQLDRLATFLGVDRRDELQTYFDQRMTPDHAHIGRWREETDTDHIAAIDADYRRIYNDLADEGVRCLPVHPDTADQISLTAATSAMAADRTTA